MYHFTIDKEAARPIYQQIKDQLLDLIVQGHLKPGQKIPSAREMSQQMGVSRLTVAQAVHELVREGRLFTVAGKGTFITHMKKLEPDLGEVWGFSDNFQTQGYKVSSQLIRFDTISADASLSAALQVPEKTPLYRLMRKRMLDDQPVGVETAHLVKADCPGLDKLDWNTQSLYAALRELYSILLVCGTNYVEATAADEATARLLQIPKNSPVLASERITCAQNSRPVELVRAFYRSDRMRMRVDMTSDNKVNLLTSKI